MKTISTKEETTKTVSAFAAQCQNQRNTSSKYFEKLILKCAEDIVGSDTMFRMLSDKVNYLLEKFSELRFVQFVFKKFGEGTFTVRYYRGGVITIGAPEFKGVDVKPAENLKDAFDYCNFHGYQFVRMS